MDRILGYLKTAKFWAGVIGAGLLGAGGVAGAPAWLLTIGAILTGVATWELPYQPFHPKVNSFDTDGE